MSLTITDLAGMSKSLADMRAEQPLKLKVSLKEIGDLKAELDACAIVPFLNHGGKVTSRQ
jgi:hypothetical protein